MTTGRVWSANPRSAGQISPGKGFTEHVDENTPIGLATRPRYTEPMVRKASVVIEKDEHGFYAWCPELRGCQSQGRSLEETLANIKEAIELHLETLPPDERDTLLSREILTTAVEVNA